MGKIEDCEKIIRDHDYRLGKAAPMYTGITLTADETASLLDYLEVWFPENLKSEEEDWDSLEWLYNVLSVWKKCKAAQEPKGNVTFGDIAVTPCDSGKDETFF